MTTHRVSAKYSNDEIYEAIKNLRSGIPMPDDMLEYCKKDPSKSIQVALNQGARWIDAESYMIDCAISSQDWSFSRSLIIYCKNIIKGRWPELEDAFKSNPQLISGHPFINEYCNEVLKSRWYAIEQYITNPAHIKDYAYRVIKSRWLERETEILKSLDVAYTYCVNVIEERWKEYEDALTSFPDSSQKQSQIVAYASRFGRWKEAEQYIKIPEHIINYAMNVIGGRWLEKESLLVQSPGHAFYYAQEVIKGPFPEAEKSLLNSSWYFDYFTFATTSSRALATQLSNQFPEDMTIGEVLKIIADGRNPDFENKLLNSTHNQGKAVWYAVNVLKDRWPEMEEKIKKSAKWSVTYARDVLKGRWEEAEKYISKNDKYLSQYAIEVIKGRLPDILHNRMIATSVKNPKDRNAKRYFEMLEQMSG